jgi:hypothetical protein
VSKSELESVSGLALGGKVLSNQQGDLEPSNNSRARSIREPTAIPAYLYGTFLVLVQPAIDHFSIVYFYKYPLQQLYEFGKCFFFVIHGKKEVEI